MTGKNTKASTAFSKSLYIRGLQGHKSLYLHKHHPELKDEVPEDQKVLFNIGYEVGDYAKQLFPCGVEIQYDGLSHSGQIEKTRAEIEKGTETIYEAAFSHNGIFVKVDILHICARYAWTCQIGFHLSFCRDMLQKMGAPRHFFRKISY